MVGSFLLGSSNKRCCEGEVRLTDARSLVRRPVMPEGDLRSFTHSRPFAIVTDKHTPVPLHSHTVLLTTVTARHATLTRIKSKGSNLSLSLPSLHSQPRGAHGRGIFSQCLCRTSPPRAAFPLLFGESFLLYSHAASLIRWWAMCEATLQTNPRRRRHTQVESQARK